MGESELKLKLGNEGEMQKLPCKVTLSRRTNQSRHRGGKVRLEEGGPV